jgi:hypothetical protein
VITRANEGGAWERRLHRKERLNVRATIETLGRSTIGRVGYGMPRPRRHARDGRRAQSSNVGSEEIDLHTFSSHLVHFDIEWNPARMEQREGRIDRFGRHLKEPVNVYFVLVRS